LVLYTLLTIDPQEYPWNKYYKEHFKIYNGVIKVLPVGKNRLEVIKGYCKLHSIDIGKSYAYSDHYSDIPLLENIGNPAAINPDRKLRDYAKKNKWKIIDVRM